LSVDSSYMIIEKGKKKYRDRRVESSKTYHPNLSLSLPLSLSN
jgi:hypothetical protein